MSTLRDAAHAGHVVLDGGLATTLEAAGHDLGGGLWSARLLLDQLGAIEAVHRAFFAAGAQVATTASYQASELSLQRAGVDPALLPQLLRRSVDAAVAARDDTCPGGWVAGSVGPYGASLADGSEYTGRYGLGSHAVTVSELRAFHRPRMEQLLGAGADVLACETVPRAAEVEALAIELADLGAPAWVSVTPARGGTSTRRGEPLASALEPLAGVANLLAVGVNCCAPEDVLPAMQTVLEVTGQLGLAYPNSGETWDASTQTWRGRPRWDAEAVRGWADAGTHLLGGCCRVDPSAIAHSVRVLSS